MTASETSPLVGAVKEGGDAENGASVAAIFGWSDPSWRGRILSRLLGGTQLALLALFAVGTTYSPEDYSAAQYVVFRDVMVMLLLGFGFLMSFLRRYGLGAVGFTMILTAIAVQLNVFVELLCRYVYLSVGGEPGGEADDTVFPLPLTVATFVDGEFAAATLLISYGAVIGRASPLQLVVMALCQSLAYAFNKVVLVLGLVGAEDVGGSMTIHMFGAYFGLAVSYVLGRPKPSTSTNADPSAVSDLTALIGTTLLWVYWPSFVGATETGIPENENVCVMHTVLALLGSTGAAFYASHRLCHHKFDPVHIANSTLAGGVAVGSSARLNMTPAGALGLGIVAGILSVYGYVYSTPYLERAFNVYDTCGVGNLHGLPSLLGGLSSVIFVAISGGSSDVNADEFLKYGTGFGQCTDRLPASFAPCWYPWVPGTQPEKR